jgi:type II secretion system protein N
VKFLTLQRAPLERSHSAALRQGAAAPRVWMLTGYGVFAAILLVAFVVASFPYVDTMSSVLAPMRLKLVVHGQAMNFPFGARLHGVQLFSTAGQSERLLLASPDVMVAPGLTSLLGRPSLNISAHVFGGVVHASVHQRAQLAGINFAIDSISLAQSELRDVLGAVVSGEVSGAGSAQLAGPDIMTLNARTILHGHDITVAIVNGLSPLRLGALTGTLSLENGIVDVRSIEAHGPDGSVKVNGEIQLAPVPAESTIRLNVSLAPSADGNAHFGVFLNMLPHPPADGPYQVEGPLRAPTVS